MTKLLSMYLSIAGIDYQIWKLCARKHKILKFLYAFIWYYLLILSIYFFYSLFIIPLTFLPAIVLSFFFGSVSLLTVMSFHLTNQLNSISQKKTNALFIARMFKFMMISLIFFFVSKSVDIYLIKLRYPTMKINHAYELIQQIVELNVKYSSLKMIALMNMVILFLPIVLPFIIVDKTYLKLKYEIEDDLIQKENNFAKEITQMEYDKIYLKYKGAREFKHSKKTSLSTKKDSNSIHNHTLFLHDWKKNK
jgi:hypothetical protein